MQEVLNNIGNCEQVKDVAQEVLKNEELCVIVQEVHLGVLVKCLMLLFKGETFSIK